MSSVSVASGAPTFESIEERIAVLVDRNRMGAAFERAVLHYLRHDPTLGLSEVWLWDEWPERIRLGLKSDQGIDLVATDGEGKRVAVQAKFHSNPGRDVTQREVAMLFSFRPDLFERWWVVTNAVGHGYNAERATAGRGDFTWVHRDDLADSTIDWSDALQAISGKAEPQVECRRPREPEQVEAIDDTLAALEDNERVQLVMACGTGKTLVTRWITEAREDRLVLVLVPTLLLLKQFRSQWREQAAYGFVDLGVCSDADTMGSSRDVWQVHPDELGVRVTTDPVDIAGFLKGDGRRVIFGTYASSARIAEAQADPSVPAFDLVVADEAHRVAGITSRGDRNERDTKVVLDGERIRARRRLFATATPRVYGRNIRAQLDYREDITFASMDDVEHFGVEAHRLWFKRAVELGRLVDYRLSVVVVTDEEVRRLVHDRAYVEFQGRTFDAETLAALIAVRRAVGELGVRRVITFHHTIKRAQDFARELERLELDAPAVSAEHVSGSMSMAGRQRVLARLKEPEQPTVVTNARCLTEGIDVPALGAVAFVDPRSAPVDIVQAVGRVMRIVTGKELGHVIVPVYLSEEQLADPESTIESSAFEPVLEVLRALRAHDPELVTDATRIATSLGRRDAVVGGYIDQHLQFLGRELDVGGFERALELRFVDVSADGWEVGLRQLREFVNTEGHADVSSRYVAPNGFRLGGWVAHRRDEFRMGELPEVRVTALSQVPGWNWNPSDDHFAEGLAQLRRYVEQEGHAQVPSRYVADDGFRLGGWVAHRRNDAKVGRIPNERKEALDALPGWSWDPAEDSWREGLEHLEAFVRDVGHARVPQKYVADDGFKLGAWVASRRREFAGRVLDDGRGSLLAGLPGWTWDPAQDDWLDGLERLRRYVDQEGHARVPPRYVMEDGYKLGKWVAAQRSSRRKHELSAERVAALEGLNGWTWDPFENKWRSGIEHLLDFVEREGHARVPKRYVCCDGYALGGWVSNTRRKAQKGKVPPQRVRELDAVPGWTWDPLEDDWREGLAHLVEFAERNGHAMVRYSHTTDDGYPLGTWVAHRRADLRDGRLSPERRAALGRVPGWSWEPK